MNFDTKLDEVSRKPSTQISQLDAKEMQTSEVRDSPSHIYGISVLTLGPYMNEYGTELIIFIGTSFPPRTRLWICVISGSLDCQSE